MAKVIIKSGHIYPIGRSDESVAVPVKARSRAAAGRGDVLQYAGGARRYTRWDGESEQLNVTLAAGVSNDIVKKLVSWVGQTIVWRDWTGIVVWCQLQDVGASHEVLLPTSAATEIALTLITITQTAEV